MRATKPEQIPRLYSFTDNGNKAFLIQINIRHISEIIDS